MSTLNVFLTIIFCVSSFNLSLAADAQLPQNENEESALKHAKKLLEERNVDEYLELRRLWQMRARQSEHWLFLDVDVKLLQGDLEGAVTLLSRKPLSGQNESERLLRLASLNVIENPSGALFFLNEAIDKDAENPDLHTYKASLLETLHKKEAAEEEYIHAVQSAPENPFMREQLADFYIRTGQYAKGVQIFEDTLFSPSLDTIWLKTLFWSKMAMPAKVPGDLKALPPSSLAPFTSYLFALLPGVYWDAQGFEKIANSEVYLDRLQETFWLRLIEALRNGEEKLAYDLLRFNSFQPLSWAPEIEESLKTILAYRSLHLMQNSTFLINEEQLSNPAQFMSMLNRYSKTPPHDLQKLIPKNAHALLMSNHAFLLPFLIYGWNEAALQLNAAPVIPKEFPDWVALKIALALQQNRTDAIALDFGDEQHASAPLSLWVAQTALTLNKKELALKHLIPIYKRQDAIGHHAALMIQPLFFERGEFQLAKEAIRAHSDIASTVEGRELLARIAIEGGDAVEAAFLYSEIASQSAEAKSFLAIKAFKEKNWERARTLTEELLVVHPNNQLLQQNLQAIIAEEKRKPLMIK